MTETAPSPILPAETTSPTAKRRKLSLFIGVAAVTVGVILLVVLTRKKMSDEELAAALVGRWRALDVSNASLHQRKEGVATEEIEFRSDGTLEYDITLPPGQGKPILDPYAWEIVRGKLQLRYTGPGATGDMLPRLKVKVSDGRLSVPRSGYPLKEFERVTF